MKAYSRRESSGYLPLQCTHVSIISILYYRNSSANQAMTACCPGCIFFVPSLAGGQKCACRASNFLKQQLSQHIDGWRHHAIQRTGTYTALTTWWSDTRAEYRSQKLTSSATASLSAARTRLYGYYGFVRQGLIFRAFDP